MKGMTSLLRFSLIVVFIAAVLFQIPISAAEGKRGKTMTIGKTQWYTEQNTFEEMVAIAKKENKPIMAAFSAAWCGPCQSVKKMTFTRDDFQEVAKEVVLLYIEETNPKSKPYIKQNKITAFPTFMIFSKDGITLEKGIPSRHIEGFKKWIADVKAGDNYYELSKKLEKNPDDRETMLKLYKKTRYNEVDKRIQLLENIVRIKPEFNDPTSHASYENLVNLYITKAESLKGKIQKSFANKKNPLVQKIIKAYAPDKYKYFLKKSFHIAQTQWHLVLGNEDRALSFFDEFVAKKGGKLDYKRNWWYLKIVFPVMLKRGRIEDAEKYLTDIQEWGNIQTGSREKRAYYYATDMLYRSAIDFYGEKNRIDIAEKYADKLFRQNETRKRGYLNIFLGIEFASKYLIFADNTIIELKERIPATKGVKLATMTGGLAKIYAKKGEPEKGKKLILNLYHDKKAWESLNKKNQAQFFNSLAWDAYEAKIVDRTTLQIAKDSVAADEGALNLDTLACCYAALNDYTNAVETQEKAVRLLKGSSMESMRNEYRQKIEDWKKKLADK